jgi:hypothetical protein
MEEAQEDGGASNIWSIIENYENFFEEFNRRTPESRELKENDF